MKEKVRLRGEAGRVSGAKLAALLGREGATLADREKWRLAFDDGSRASVGTARRFRQLERELARKEKTLAEAAALLVLKKRKSRVCTRRTKDDDTDEESEK